MAGILMVEIFGFIVVLRVARGGDGSAGISQGACEFGGGLEGRQLCSYSFCRLIAFVWAGKLCVHIVGPANVGSMVFKRSVAGGKLFSSAARRAFRCI